jgi:hypothetical protein
MATEERVLWIAHTAAIHAVANAVAADTLMGYQAVVSRAQAMADVKINADGSRVYRIRILIEEVD